MEERMMDLKSKPTPAPDIVLKEDFDDWVMIIDPKTGNSFALNPLSAFIWKNIDGRRTVKEILDIIPLHFESVPDDVGPYIEGFMNTLLKHQLVRLL